MALLSVTVKKARYTGIQAQQYNSYVTLKLQNVKSTTVTVKGSNPCWEQDFLFETNDVNTGLLIEVWSKGMIWDRALGYNYIPLKDIQYSNEEGTGQWVFLDAELVMRDGEVVATKAPTGDSLLIDCRFELPFGRYDPPSGWKCLVAPDTQRRSGPRSLRDEDNTDWLPLGRQNLPDHWSGRDVENTVGDALQRKLERLNSNVLNQDEQTRRQHQYYGHSGYSEDSDYTSDLNYPVGQHPNSSASQFRSVAQLMRTPDRSLETSRENSYERDDVPSRSHYQSSHRLIHNSSDQPGKISQNYKSPQGSWNYSETDCEPLYYNSRPRDLKEYSSEYHDQWRANDISNTSNRKRAGRRPSLERQTTLYDDQYYSQFYEGNANHKNQMYGMQYNCGENYDQDYGYQKEGYGEEEEHKQWDSGGYYYADNYGDFFANNYQNTVNKMRSSKKLPYTFYSNSNHTYYSSLEGSSNENESRTDLPHEYMNAAARRKLLKQQRQSSDNFSSSRGWQSDDKSIWLSAEDCTYYNEHNQRSVLGNAKSRPIITPVHSPKKRTLPQIRAPSRIKASAVSLPQTPSRQLPNPLAVINRQKLSAPVSRTASADYEQNETYDSRVFNENYNYAYLGRDSMATSNYENYSSEKRTPGNYVINFEASKNIIDNYKNNEQYLEEIHPNSTEQYQNLRNSGNTFNQNTSSEEYYVGDCYSEDVYSSYYETNNLPNDSQRKFPEKKINSYIQQNMDSLESRDDELRAESFETAVDSICSSIPKSGIHKSGTDHASLESSTEYKSHPPKPSEQQMKLIKDTQNQSQTLASTLNSAPTPTLSSPHLQLKMYSQSQPQNQQQQQSTGMLGGLLGQLTKSPSQCLQAQQQPGQKLDQRSRDQSNLLSNPALAAVNATKGFFSSITNAVNNTVHNINKQHKPQQQQSASKQVQRIQVTKKGSLKQQESFQSLKELRSERNSFDGQIQDYLAPEDSEYLERNEGEFYENRDKYYEYNTIPKDYYNTSENEFPKEAEMTNQTCSKIDQQKPLSYRSEQEREFDDEFASKRFLRHQDTIDSEGKRSEGSNRNYLRQQSSIDSCVEEVVINNAEVNDEDTSFLLNSYDGARTVVDEPAKATGVKSEQIDMFRKRGSGHDNSLIEPYHRSSIVQDSPKDYASSPPSIKKQHSIDLDGLDEEEVPQSGNLSHEYDQPRIFEPNKEEPVNVVVLERRKFTARERWHRAYNIVVQQFNVSLIYFSNYLN